MEHLDAKAIRERLNAITLAIATLEQCSVHSAHSAIAAAASAALKDIAVLVTNDELVEQGTAPPNRLQQRREQILDETQARRDGAAQSTEDQGLEGR